MHAQKVNKEKICNFKSDRLILSQNNSIKESKYVQKIIQFQKVSLKMLNYVLKLSMY